MPFLDVEDGIKIYFASYQADKPAINRPVVLVHGFASNYKVNWQSTGWIEFLNKNGRNVVTFDHRGHGQSSKLYLPYSYLSLRMAGDIQALLAHININSCDMLGYSMGARIATFFTLTNPSSVKNLAIGGMGINMVTGVGGNEIIANALEADSSAMISHTKAINFRRFAEQTRSDLLALAACMRAPTTPLSADMLAAIKAKTIVIAGSEDDIAGDVATLADLIDDAEACILKNRDHMSAVGDRSFKNKILTFFNNQ